MRVAADASVQPEHDSLGVEVPGLLSFLYPKRFVASVGGANSGEVVLLRESDEPWVLWIWISHEECSEGAVYFDWRVERRVMLVILEWGEEESTAFNQTGVQEWTTWRDDSYSNVSWVPRHLVTRSNNSLSTEKAEVTLGLGTRRTLSSNTLWTPMFP